jgi:4-amino-4-deoxy-L-arabinose transferase-like glycosyltransferase
MWVTGAILCLLRAIEGVACPRLRGHGGDLTQSVVAVKSSSSNPTIRMTVSRVHVHASVDMPPTFSFFWWLAALLCVAGGALTKWTGPAFFYATAIPLLFWRGQLRLLWNWRHLAAAAIGASICLLWIGAAVASEGWDAFFATVKREALQRMLPEYAPHPDPWYVSVLHPLRLWYTNLPWSLVAVLACRPSFGRLWDARGRMLWQALHCWIWPNMLIWSLVLDHKPRHSFPMFPAIAGLAALVWFNWLRSQSSLRVGKWRLRPGRVLIAATIGWLIIKFGFVQVHMSQRHLSRDPQGKAAIIASLVPHNCILYLFKLKDEGIMFYYGRVVQRLQNPSELPSPGEPLYCILGKEEWDCWRQTSGRSAVPLTGPGFADEQGEPMVLVRVD